MVTMSPELLRRCDTPGPRYTSYPTADRFSDAFGPSDWELALAQRRQIPQALLPPLSIYVHIPFCESLCYYCACNKIVTRHRERGAGYLELLAREIELQSQALGPGRRATQLHLGGGTPTFLDDAQLARLVGMLEASYGLEPGCERSIEVDPRTVDAARLRALADMGFNRVSFGVQDFDEEVQRAVHRVQPAEQVFGLVAAARACGFRSVNVDLIYGLPRQTRASFARTLSQVRELRPDRIALYAYAHLPERFKSQRRIDAADLPAAADRLAMLSGAIEGFTDAGYDYIGMDHFALPDDSLSVARRQGLLQRNFQGYSTQPDCELAGLGVSAIGRVGARYGQNARTLDEYRSMLELGRLPVVRGLALSRDDLARRSVIMALMCQGEVLFETVEAAWLLDFPSYFRAELAQLAALREEGLVELDATGVRVTAAGRFFVRAVAMVFDRYLHRESEGARFSRIV